MWGGAHEFELLTNFPGFAAGGPQTILGVSRSRIQVRVRLEEKGTPKGGGGVRIRCKQKRKEWRNCNNRNTSMFRWLVFSLEKVTRTPLRIELGLAC